MLGPFINHIQRDISMTINLMLNLLVKYAESHKLFNAEDKEYVINQLLYLFNLDQYTEETLEEQVDFYLLLDKLLDYALNHKIIDLNIESSRDNFEAKIMDAFLPRPSELNRKFAQLYKEAPKYATDYFYQLSIATNYIKTERIKKNITYKYLGKYAELDITINLSKPEKDPKTIALMKNVKSENYPKCALCMENVGFYGTLDKAPRSNHRVVDITLNHEKNAWGFQYSPYSYYNEHAIILKKKHEPMRVDATTFKELIDFINKFPHYMIGSNAGLPIVGGSILSHYHFQAGRYDFPIEKARVLTRFKRRRVDIEILDWPLSVVRVSGKNEFDVLDYVNLIFESWKKYANEPLHIYSETTDKHNTITPIVKLKEGNYQFYVVLRNNITTPDRPYGLFHPRDEYFHIKKENIGLIEVMGLAVLPGRLKTELDLIKQCLINHEDPIKYDELQKHLTWINDLRIKNYPIDSLEEALKSEVGLIFEKVLEDCGVFKSENLKDFALFVERAIN